MGIDWTDFIATVIGAGLAALFGLWQARRIHALAHRDRVHGLIRALEGELRVVDELAAIDLDVSNLGSRHEADEKLVRLAAARDVFEHSAGELGNLPGALPNSVVRAYGRIAAKEQAMRAKVKDAGFWIVENGKPRNPKGREEYEQLRREISTEVQNLLAELLNALKNIKDAQATVN